MNNKLEPREWHVFIHTNKIGYIGTVYESTEEYARLAALSKWGMGDDARRAKDDAKFIYIGDDFDVRPA